MNFLDSFPLSLIRITLRGECWRHVSGYEGIYAVSNMGRVFSMPRPRRYYGKGKPLYIWWKGGLLKRTPAGGYLVVGLSKNGILRQWRISILVALAFLPNPERKPTVDHIDGIKTNNNVSNLRWATGVDQSETKRKLGSLPRGGLVLVMLNYTKGIFLLSDKG